MKRELRSELAVVISQAMKLACDHPYRHNLSEEEQSALFMIRSADIAEWVSDGMSTEFVHRGEITDTEIRNTILEWRTRRSI
jgi:hypothetical protein